MTLKLTSTAFAEGAMIPKRHTCDGQDVSPPLSWTGLPPGVQSLALIMDDPDAPVGTWDHWVLFNIPADAAGLPEGIPGKAELDNGAVHGKNSWGRLGYGGPCPPGGTHRYFFKLYALDTPLELESGVSKSRLLNSIEKNTLARAQLMGIYRR